MPTYVTIRFIRDYAKSHKVANGRNVIVWNSRYSKGDRLRLRASEARTFIKQGYAKAV